MRARFAVLLGVLLFSVALPTTAHASGWSAFVAWLSDLDPRSGGVGIERRFVCRAAGGPPSLTSACDRDTVQKVVIKASAAILFGSLNGDTITVVPVLGSVETEVDERFSFGGGAGVIHVGGTLVGGITRSLIQGQVTIKFPSIRLGVRPELNVIPKGFPAGAFAVGSAATGAEVVPGLSVVWSF